MRIFRQVWDSFELYVANIALAFLVVMLFVQAAARYFFHTGLAWTEELSRFSFIFFVYLSASVAVFRSTHIKVEVIVNKLPSSLRRIVTAFSALVQIAFFITAGVCGVSLTVDMIAFPVYSPSLLLPLYYVYFIIPLSYFLMAIRLVQRSLSSLKE